MECCSCGKVAAFQCSACMFSCYCSEACQRYARKHLGHALVCQKKQARLLAPTLPIAGKWQNAEAFNTGAYYNFSRKLFAQLVAADLRNHPNSHRLIPALVWAVLPEEGRRAYDSDSAVFEAVYEDCVRIALSDEPIDYWEVEGLVELAWAAMPERDRTFFSTKRERDDEVDPFARAVRQRGEGRWWPPVDYLTDGSRFPRDLLYLVLEGISPLEIMGVLRLNRELTDAARDKAWSLICRRDLQSFVDRYRAKLAEPALPRPVEPEYGADFEQYCESKRRAEGSAVVDEAVFMAPVIGVWDDDAVGWAERYRRFTLLRTLFLTQSLTICDNTRVVGVSDSPNTPHASMYMDVFAEPGDDEPLLVVRYFEASCRIEGKPILPFDQERKIEELERRAGGGGRLDSDERRIINLSVLNVAVQRLLDQRKLREEDVHDFFGFKRGVAAKRPGFIFEFYAPDPSRLHPKTVAYMTQLNREYRAWYFYEARGNDLRPTRRRDFFDRGGTPNLAAAVQRIVQDLVMTAPRLETHFSDTRFVKMSVDERDEDTRFGGLVARLAMYEDGVIHVAGMDYPIMMNRWHRQAVYRPFESFDPRPLVV